MDARSLSRTFPTPAATAAFAAELAQGLGPSDTLLLDGPVGAGKTHFARALIQSILVLAEDVPSPTFTLVQHYDTARGPLVHTDLYRLTGADEIEELGLAEAMQDSICLIEWPDRLGPYRPNTALSLTLTPTGEDSRAATFTWQDPRWDVLRDAA